MMNKRISIISLLSIVGTAALLSAFIPTSKVAASDVQLCPDGQPCYPNIYPEGNDLVARWRSNQEFDVYNVRWFRDGRDWASEVRGGTSGQAKLRNYNRGIRYGFTVQGCNRNFLRRSTCSEWTSTYYNY